MNRPAALRYPLLIPLVTAMGATAPATAQVSVVLEEVIVTARKRGTESLQDIGGSIQVLDGSAFSETMTTGFADYMRQVPSLSANSSGVGQAQLLLLGARHQDGLPARQRAAHQGEAHQVGLHHKRGNALGRNVQRVDERHVVGRDDARDVPPAQVPTHAQAVTRFTQAVAT